MSSGWTPAATGAGEGIRTLDPNLGKILLLVASLEIIDLLFARTADFRDLFRDYRANLPGNRCRIRAVNGHTY
jgi:hypothetical protein